MTSQRIVDMRLCPPGVPAHAYAYRALYDLDVDERALMTTGEDPGLLLRQLVHLTRDRLAFAVCAVAPGLWQIEVALKTASPARTLIDVLKRDHLRLDTLLIDCVRLAESGCADEARAIWRVFIGRLRRHIDIEERIVLGLLSEQREQRAADETSLIQREHEAVLEQLQIIDEVFDQPALDVAALQTWTSMLAATLAKHEFREETLIFPLWLRQFGAADEMAQWVAAAQTQLDGTPA